MQDKFLQLKLCTLNFVTIFKEHLVKVIGQLYLPYDQFNCEAFYDYFLHF